MKSCRVLITGGTGFVGTWLHAALPHAECLNSQFYSEFMEKSTEKFDWIFHLAPVSIDPVIKLAQRHNAKVLYASSGAADDLITAYGVDKRINEQKLQLSGLKYVITRLYTFCGEHLRDKFAITQFIRQALEGKITCYDNGTVRSYMYAADMAVWMLRLMATEAGIFNVGNEREITMPELAQRVGRIAGVPVEQVEAPDNDGRRYVPDCSKAHDLGLFEQYDLDYGIERMLNESPRL